MDSIKNAVVGGVISIVIGGTVYTVSQTDIINNFAADTGMSQQQAEQYVSSVKEEDLVPWGELGSEQIEYGQEVLSSVSDIDCVNYEYEWESATLTCNEGKDQLQTIGNSEVSVGHAFNKLDSNSASEADITKAIQSLDNLNNAYELEIMSWLYDQVTVDEFKNTNSYNKALLKAALDGT